MPRFLPIRVVAPAAGKSGFVNRVAGFAKRARAWPGMPIVPAVSVAAAIVMTLVGGFGTGALPLDRRALFWALLMLANFAKWQSWFVLMVKQPSDWTRAVLIGFPVLSATLPFEISGLLSLVGVDAQIGLGAIWARALVIGTVIYVMIMVLRRNPDAAALPVANPPPSPVLSFAHPPMLARAGIARISDLIAVEAEDHYCRLHLATGGSVLLHQRFGDAMTALAAVDGTQVHRGFWVAAAAVSGAVRDGRRWRLALSSGLSVPVSARFAAKVRGRGWLHPPTG
ncbi:MULTISPECIES: LytTR family DNA-binding domain-containing protein [unclassified Sphingomonas]|uniref:LytTR family DNA-binding domain-containing protein n=1 Tax=unclassified Sphingomonas TaxID=196159 RepID=UPI0026B6145A